MDDRKEIAEKVESGEYFAEARDWYIRKYLYNFVERSYLIILFGFVGFLVIMVASYYLNILPIRKNLPVRVNITDAAEQYTKITYLGNETKDFNVNHVLIRYFSARFTEAFESYDYRNNFQKLKINKEIIEKLGTEGIKHFYSKKTSYRNSDSMVLKYRRSLIRQVQINSNNITLVENKNDSLESGLKDYTVTINFNVKEIKERKDIDNSKWQAKINLYFEQIYYDYDEKEFNDLNFKVYGYESKKI